MNFPASLFESLFRFFEEYNLTVDENDKGKIIGKNGKIAKSIRNVLKLASTKDKNRYILEII